jgi:pimeloyl-ACP methyl ester carboxylesterase
MLLAHRAWGHDGDKVALLVHGGRDASTTWKKVGPWLAEKGWHAIAVDMRGHGRSQIDSSASDRSLTTVASDFVQTIGMLRPDVGKVDLLIGHSLGGLACLTCVAEYPDFARRLVVEDTPGQSFNAERVSKATAQQIEMARSHPSPETALPESESLEGEELKDKIAAAAAADPVFLPELVRSFKTLDVNALVARCVVPTLVIVGRDKGTPVRNGWPEIAQYSLLSGEDRVGYLRALRDGAVEEIEAGHYVHTQAFPEFVSALDGWLKKTGELR